MSRRVSQPVDVHCNKVGEPFSVSLYGQGRPLPVIAVRSHWREWVGVLDGEPERDVWQVELPTGFCELHCLRFPLTTEPTCGDWILYRWED
jgi:hypothetical protein